MKKETKQIEYLQNLLKSAIMSGAPDSVAQVILRRLAELRGEVH